MPSQGFTRGQLRFVENPDFIKEAMRSPGMVHMLGFKADMAAEKAKDIAPVETGAYRDSIEGQSGFADNAARGRVVARDFKAGWIEFGTWKWPAHATLRLGAEAAGLVVKGGRRLRWRPRKNGGWY